jgi:site-specific DNA-methyltransferase (adenine-specific)
MSTTVFNGRVEWWAAHYKGAKYHALLCDPPYHLTSITKRFGKGDSAPAQFGTDGAFARASRGFMGKAWDGGDIAFRPDTWAALTEHLHAGGFGMAFASSRGWHRMAVAIEDAGLIIHPTIFNWAFGSGFPKATRVPDERFEGHRYGAQAIKPAVEPIIVFQKPYEGRPVDCITSTGAGALNIDAARIGNGGQSQWTEPRGLGYDTRPDESQDAKLVESNLGRWPANFVLSEDAAVRLDEQSGHLVSGEGAIIKKASSENGYRPSVYGAESRKEGTEMVKYADEGGASRFYHNYGWTLEVQEQIDNADPVRYEAKAAASEREAGLDHLLARTVNDGRQTPIDNPYQRGETERLNVHPTVKPIGLTEWLAKLLLPPKAYAERRILIPFAGSGSEMIGAYRAGWEHVYGIEMTREYAQIARARLQYWRLQGVQLELFALAA